MMRLTGWPGRLPGPAAAARAAPNGHPAGEGPPEGGPDLPSAEPPAWQRRGVAGAQPQDATALSRPIAERRPQPPDAGRERPIAPAQWQGPQSARQQVARAGRIRTGPTRANGSRKESRTRGTQRASR